MAKIVYQVTLPEGTTEAISEELAREIMKMNRRIKFAKYAIVAVGAVALYKKVTEKNCEEV